MRCFAYFSHHIFEIRSVFCTYISIPKGLFAFQRLSGLLWPWRGTVLGSAGLAGPHGLPRVGETAFSASFLLVGLLGEGKKMLPLVSQAPGSPGR